ncbi:hypothetical protein L208DRAFT_1402680 [Tricholoma matsutake]|nr:hypothetical protein L208DRAFT_1402680 [Tricholoma matsutake 945]
MASYNYQLISIPLWDEIYSLLWIVFIPSVDEIYSLCGLYLFPIYSLQVLYSALVDTNNGMNLHI